MTETQTIGAEGVSQRRHERHLCLEGGTLRLSIRPHFQGHEAMIVDVSTSGIGMLPEEALEVESVLVFEVKAMQGADAVSRIARVRNCRPCPTPREAPWLPPAPVIGDFLRRIFGMRTSPLPPECWLVGCEFDRPLSEQELSRLLASVKSSNNLVKE
jgi:hypothetical protein